MTPRKPVPHAAQVRLRRSMRALTIGARQAERRLQAEVGPLQASEMHQAVHVDVNGVAASAVAASDVTVSFEHAFLSRIVVDADDVEPTEPTFGFGYELASDANVMMTACVRGFDVDDRNLIVGARVRIMVVQPGAVAGVNYNATVHLSFSGYAAPDGEDDDQANPVPAIPDTVPQPSPSFGGASG